MPLPSKPVAMFGKDLKLVGIFPSIFGAAKATKTLRQSIIKCLNGRCHVANNAYWRVIPEDYVLDQDDVGVLSLIDFDKQVGNPDSVIYVTKTVKVTKRMKIKRSEYKTISNK